MALIILQPLIFLTIFINFVAAQQTNGSVSIGSSLTAAPDVEPWLSSSGDFAFGFQQLQGNDNFLLSIWYDKIPNKTVIWYPEGGRTVSRGSKVELINGRGLVLSDPQGRQVWNTSGSFSDLSYGVMNDTGNFVLFRSDSSKIWESFEFPADTLLPSQIMERGGVINSRIRKTNFSSGRFQLRLLQDGNLVLNSRDIPSDYAYKSYYASGTNTNDTSNSTSSGERVIFDDSGYMYILRANGQRYDLTPTDNNRLPSGDYYHRITLDYDGVLTQYSHSKNLTGDDIKWDVIWQIPERMCAAITGVDDSRACGFNNVCDLDSDRPNCECSRGFSLLDPNDPTGDCKPDFAPSCGSNNNDELGLVDFIELTSVNWPQSDYMRIRSVYEDDCKRRCMEDCFCVVAIYGGNQCWKKQLPLSNGRRGSSEISNAFVKVRKGAPPNVFSEESKDKRSLIFVGPALLTIAVFVFVGLIGITSISFFMIYKKKARNPYPSSNVIDTNLSHFTYQELVEATNGFNEELGRGAFGIVYKGVIETNIVAVKKLDRVVQDGEKEFKTEVNAIAKTHHKNLVQLFGYCDDGEQRLLIYEYMSNGTLAAFLFGEIRPSWKQRSDIAVGIAKGLAYLHEECNTQIIHCDIKPQNILLDDYYNAKISDFGLAKLLSMNQSRTNTGIRGTKGYVAPEWFRNASVTVKVDVYSFGVLLLEIVSCRKSVVFESDKEDVEVLTDVAWDWYQEGRVDVFVENDSEALDDYKRLMRFVKVGLWCVQENPSLRPTMRKVVQMLEGVSEVADPSCPSPFSIILS